MAKKFVILGSILIGVLIASCAGTHPDQPPNPQHLISGGETVFLHYCAECHQRDGNGWLPLYPRFAGNPLITLADPSPIIETVMYGQGSMPAFRDRLDSDQIAAVLSYIRNAWGNSASAVSPKQIH